MMGTQHRLVGIGFGVATALYVAEGLGQPGPAMAALLGSSVGCMLPDIDHNNSKIGRKRKFITNLTSKATTGLAVGAIILGAIAILATSVGMINSGVDVTMLGLGIVGAILFMAFRKWAASSKTFKWLTHHRGFMHTLIPPVLIALIAYSTSFGYWHYGFLGLAIGYVSHLIADMITVEGCPILWPLTKNNIHILFFRLKTKNSSTWIAAAALAALPVVLVFLLVGSGT